MRLVDSYIDALLSVRSLATSLTPESATDAQTLKDKFILLLDQAQLHSRQNGFAPGTVNAALFPVIAYVDEMILTSQWNEKATWQKDSLQRHYFNTTNAGQEFFERLNQLNRQGEDRSIREVYLLCLGLGFKGQYFMPSDRPKLEEIRVFNLDLLLPEDANVRLEKATLFEDAYQEHVREGRRRNSRLDLTPYFIATPFIIVISVFIGYALQINTWMTQILDLVK